MDTMNVNPVNGQADTQPTGNVQSVDGGDVSQTVSTSFENPPQQPEGVQGTSFQNPGQLTEAYKSLQSEYTRNQQSLKELQERFDQVLDFAVKQQQAPVVPETKKPEVLSYTDEQLLLSLQQRPKETLMQFADEIAKKQISDTIGPLQQQLKTTQAILNQQAVSNTLAAMQQEYGSVDPEFQANLNEAVKMTTGPLRDMAERNPAETLRMAYEMNLGKKLQNTQFIQQLRNSAIQAAQQQDMQKMQANPMMNQPPNQPNQPYNPSGQPNLSDLARQIAIYDDPSSLGGLQHLQVRHQAY